MNIFDFFFFLTLYRYKTKWHQTHSIQIVSAHLTLLTITSIWHLAKGGHIYCIIWKNVYYSFAVPPLKLIPKYYSEGHARGSAGLKQIKRADSHGCLISSGHYMLIYTLRNVFCPVQVLARGSNRIADRVLIKDSAHPPGSVNTLVAMFWEMSWEKAPCQWRSA